MVVGWEASEAPLLMYGLEWLGHLRATPSLPEPRVLASMGLPAAWWLRVAGLSSVAADLPRVGILEGSSGAEVHSVAWPQKSHSSTFLCVLLMRVAIDQPKSTGKRSGPSLSREEGSVWTEGKVLVAAILETTNTLSFVATMSQTDAHFRKKKLCMYSFPETHPV